MIQLLNIITFWKSDFFYEAVEEKLERKRTSITLRTIDCFDNAVEEKMGRNQSTKLVLDTMAKNETQPKKSDHQDFMDFFH